MTFQPPTRGCVFVPSIQPGCTLPDDPTKTFRNVGRPSDAELVYWAATVNQSAALRLLGSIDSRGFHKEMTDLIHDAAHENSTANGISIDLRLSRGARSGMILITDSTEFADTFFTAMNRIANQEHVPMGKNPKAAPSHPSDVNFIFATCSCGWRGKRPCETQEQALKNATEHADTLNARRS